MSEPVLLLLLPFALPFAAWPEPLVRFSEVADAIGSQTRRTEVEAAPTKVALYRYGGIAACS